MSLPVICCGNATAGGAGKTTVALDLGERLKARGLAAHFLLRGYGVKLKGPARVDLASHDSRAVGDEALLLAAIAPTWVSADRAAGGAAAQALAATLARLLADPAAAQAMAGAAEALAQDQAGLPGRIATSLLPLIRPAR